MRPEIRPATPCEPDLAHENVGGQGGKQDTLLVTVEETARLFNIDRSTVYDMLRRGDLPSVKIGRRRLISRQALINFISRSESVEQA